MLDWWYNYLFLDPTFPTNLVMSAFAGALMLTIIFGILGTAFGGRVRRGANGDPVASSNLGWIEWLTGFFRKR